MIAVEPKRDCPHVDEHVSSSITKVVNVLTPCARCQDGTENWICCKCGEVFCSRFKNSHMVEHNKESSHAIAASFSDLSVWCYSCDSYIKHAVLNPILDALRESKFPAAAGSKPTEPKEAPKPQGEKDGVTEGIAKLSIKEEPAAAPKTRTANILSSLTIDGIADYIKSGKCKNIIVMTGAGVSVAAGIPDFRTPGTGLYYNLQKYNLPYPTAVFEINYFRNKPEPFFLLAKELYPGNFVPTHVHYFIKLLHEKGLLLRNYTQNIDTLERVANIPASALVEAHGTFGTAHCIECRKEHSSEFVKDHVFSDKIPKCEGCSGLVKPDIVFFGESLPPRFFDMMSKDFPICDLLLVIGTSLKVQPFASLIKRVPPTTPRLLINMEEVGTSDLTDIILPSFSTGFVFNHANNVRDVKHLGECQSGVKRLAELCGWGQELAELVEKEQKIILASVPPTASTAPPSSTPSATPSTPSAPAPTPSSPSAPAAPTPAPTPAAAAAPVASPTPTTTPAPSLEASVNTTPSTPSPSPSPAPSSAPTPSTTPAPSSTPTPSTPAPADAPAPAPSSSTPSPSSSTPPPPSSTAAPPAEAPSAAPAPSSDVPPASL